MEWRPRRAERLLQNFDQDRRNKDCLEMASAKETNSVKEKTVSVWGDKVHPKVRIIGSGAQLVYLHGGYGPVETELLDELGKSITVYAPENPGITSGDEDAYKALDDIWSLVRYYY